MLTNHGVAYVCKLGLYEEPLFVKPLPGIGVGIGFTALSIEDVLPPPADEPLPPLALLVPIEPLNVREPIVAGTGVLNGQPKQVPGVVKTGGVGTENAGGVGTANPGGVGTNAGGVGSVNEVAGVGSVVVSKFVEELAFVVLPVDVLAEPLVPVVVCCPPQAAVINIRAHTADAIIMRMDISYPL